MNVIPASLDDAAAAELTVDTPNALIDFMVVMGHSTALAGNIVSPLNPRVILLAQQTFLAFQRGVQQVELASIDREDRQLNLYLLTFRQACNDAPSGCGPGDIYTPLVERDWVSTALHDDEDLKNTPEDCRQCHQRALPAPMLLMRELQGPWAHFFGPDFVELPDEAPGTGIARAFKRAKQGEVYAGVPAVLMGHTAGVFLQNRVENTQPLNFDSETIEQELAGHDPASGAPRRSPSWDEAYGAFKRGEQLALPHYEGIPTDPNKQAALSRAYERYRAQEIAAEELPDLADIFPDDPQVRAEIGLQNDPSATPADALVQTCGPCHNDVLDQTLSRARFSIALGRMSREELDLAIARIEQAPSAPGVMPPPGTRQLDPQARERLLEYLRNDARNDADEAFLERAAQLGMAKDPFAGMR